MVPFHHQYLLSDFLQSLLQGRDHVALENYSFSGLKGQTKVSRQGLCFFSSKVTLVFSCPSREVVMLLARRIFEKPEYQLGELQVSPESIAEEEEVCFEGPSSKFICISPMVLLSPLDDSNAKKFISPESDYFSDLLYESTMSRMEQSGHYTPEQIASFYKFQVVPDQTYLNRIKSEEKKFARVYPVFIEGKKMEVRGYTMPFTIFAEPEVQKFVFECGMGEMCHKGFGMLDVANSAPHKRARFLNMEEVTQQPQPPSTVPGSMPRVRRENS
ncbi:CRISPR-associated endoribonuclease Cas6 [Catalinimonas alkaloidigena]|uniref:CRISPR-associated endoribonuclease Cas6 n=1 Tax=Catalinimonas alkaloidigena TaxID=1075417 RepID=A0A1G8WFE2_9BACT|nr:CRISPR-associated endoribonuclease Cas6 [Catalinimonas alkaloidigena]SDJ76260.1 CRISPR-associated endoribonuclease Cas6 [Catalinimonas alkaloidigena]